MNKLTNNGRTAPSEGDVRKLLDDTLDGPVDDYCPECDHDNTPDKPVKIAADEKELFNNYKRLGGNPKAFKHAMCFFNKHQKSSFKTGGGREQKLEINVRS
jgi:hypothetical protein